MRLLEILGSYALFWLSKNCLNVLNPLFKILSKPSFGCY